MASISAAEEGRRVLLIEKNRVLGRKVLVSGNGRCNITNAGAQVENFHGENNRFLHGIFARFGVQDTRDFFEGLGLRLKEEKLGRLFPVSNQAVGVVELLEHRMKNLGVQVRLDSPVRSIQPDGRRFRVLLDGGEILEASRLILAPGGKSFPKLGTTGDGYDWARKLGHRVTRLTPALVPMETDVAPFRSLKGIRLEAEVTSRVGRRQLRTFRGDLLFTAYGLSGPTILAASSDLARRLPSEEPATFQINFLPGMTAQEAEEVIRDRWSRDPARNLGFSFTGWLPGRMGPALLEALGIPHLNQTAGQVSRQTLTRIARALTSWSVAIKGMRSFDEAEVTAGGVSLEEIDLKTLESRSRPGLFFCGEVLDIHGDWGGYNFQFAWSTGYVAGKEAARPHRSRR